MLHARGNTISKLAMDITDTTATVAVKINSKREKPTVLAIATGTGLSDNAENIGKLLNRKNYYFVPFRQNNPITKPRAIAYEPEYIVKTIKYAIERKQISPILL